MSGIVFISYRRSDAEGYAGRLYDRLEPKLTAEKLFMDVDSIGAGKDFVRVMREKVAESDVVLAIIGRGWLEATDKQGARRLEDPGDPVRIELETALAADKIIIPVLCGQVDMPGAETLPETLKPLSTRNALRVANDRFRGDMATLEGAIDDALAEAQAHREAEEAQRAAEAQRKAEQERLAAEAAEQARLEELATQAAEQAEQKRAAEEAERRRAERARLLGEAEEARRKAEELERLAGENDEPAGHSGVSASLLNEQIAKAEELAHWDFIKNRSRPPEFREHMRRWPTGTTARMARTTLEGLEWDTLRGCSDTGALRSFLDEFPDGEHTTEVGQRLQAIADTEAKVREREAALTRAAEKRRAEEVAANDARDDETFAAAFDDNTPLAYAAYLVAYPKGRSHERAQRAIAELRAKKDRGGQRSVSDGVTAPALGIPEQGSTRAWEPTKLGRPQEEGGSLPSRRKTLITGLLLGLGCLVLVGRFLSGTTEQKPAAPAPTGPTGYVLGMTLMEADGSDYGVGGQALLVTDVATGSAAATAGVKPNTMLTMVEDAPVWTLNVLGRELDKLRAKADTAKFYFRQDKASYYTCLIEID